MKNTENQWKGIFLTGGIATVIALTGILLDVVIGNVTGGDLSALPQTAAERFAQFHQNVWLGLYNLDLLNAINQMLMIPAFFALFAAHMGRCKGYALLALIVFLFGSIILVANNVALPMMELSHKYFMTSENAQQMLYAAAGESLLVQGAHGSAGIFLGFFLPNLANLVMSVVMLKGGIFTKVNAWLGIAGSILMMLYIILVSFGSGIESMATAFAMPGGIMLMTWMILFAIKLLKMSK